MPRPTVTVVGSYPKPPQEGGDFRLRKTLQALDRGEAREDEVRAAQNDLVREILEEQAAASIEIATDGQVRWDDGQTRFAEGMQGFAVGGLTRYFDNNTYFRQPTVKGRVSRRGPIVVDEFRFAASESAIPVKPVLTGPYTLATLSRNEHYKSVSALLTDLTVALNEEAKDLVAEGATIIQFDEPALARVPGHPPGDLDMFAEVAPMLVEGVEATTVLQTYFGDVAEHGPGFFSLPFDAFGLDFVAGPANLEAVHEFPADKVLSAGLVDGRNTKLEPVESLVEAISVLTEAADLDRLWITPSSGLEFLPRGSAKEKCRLLADAAAPFREET